MNNQKQYMEIDVLKLIRAVLKKWWIVVLATAVIGILAFDYASYFVTPLYQSKVQIIVDSSGDTSEKTTTADINASQKLADTYMIILKTNPILEAVKEYTKLDYSAEALKNMIKTRAVNNTEIFEIIVTTPSPENSRDIANALAEILPEHVKKLRPNSLSTLTLLEPAELPQSRVSPNRTKYAIVGAMIGFIVSVAIICIVDLLDDVIHDEEYLTKTYELPILAVVPDLYEAGQGHSTEYAYVSSKTPEKGENENA